MAKSAGRSQDCGLNQYRAIGASSRRRCGRIIYPGSRSHLGVAVSIEYLVGPTTKYESPAWQTTQPGPSQNRLRLPTQISSRPPSVRLAGSVSIGKTASHRSRCLRACVAGNRAGVLRRPARSLGRSILEAARGKRESLQIGPSFQAPAHSGVQCLATPEARRALEFGVVSGKTATRRS